MVMESEVPRALLAVVIAEICWQSRRATVTLRRVAMTARSSAASMARESRDSGVEAGLDRRLGGCGPECGEMEESLLEVLVQLERPVEVDLVEGHQGPQVVGREGHQGGAQELAGAAGATPRTLLGHAPLELSPDLGDAFGVGGEEVGELAGHCPAECTRARSERPRR